MEISSNESPIITLTSSQSLSIRQVQLFDAAIVADLAVMRAELTTLIGDSATNIGFVGSPAWVAGGTVAVGILRAMASAGAKQQAQDLLRKIEIRQRDLGDSAKFFHHSLIENIGIPNPQSWGCSEKLIVKERKQIAPPVRNYFLGKSLDTIEGAEEEHEIIRFYSFSGGEFIRISSDIGIIDFRWSQIVAFRPVQS